ncbi:MAG: FHA domain-containing protein [Myxococcales bacterium]|nr:FHA domain-containing protein [Myxococcales bacterium]
MLTSPRLKRIDLDGFRVEEVALPDGAGTVTVGRLAPADLLITSAAVSRLHCRFASDGGRWRLEDVASAGGTWLNGRRVTSQVLSHGDAVWLGETILVFLDRPEVKNADLEAAIAERPDDSARVRVWADWLLDHGDPFGEHLLAPAPSDFVLEGLAPLVKDGRLELDWQHGLIRVARLRCINDATYSNVELLARLLSLRAARWMSELVVDLSTWVMPSATRLQLDAAAVLRGLVSGPALPALRRLSLGYVVEQLPHSPFIDALWGRLERRYPLLETAREALLPLARHAWLEVEAVPDGIDFHHAGPSEDRIPLDAGVWVGSSAQGSLRAVPPGVHRQGLAESFLVRQEAPVWCLLPIENGVTLNGRPAVATRLLPGDRVEDPRGVRFRFEVGR